jgi:hypothetical protein
MFLKTPTSFSVKAGGASPALTARYDIWQTTLEKAAK